MKRATLIFVLSVATLVTVVSYFYSTENVIPIEAELSKYPEISVFMAGRTGFRGIRFNLDTNYYSFAFSTSFVTAETYFAAVEPDATKEGWRLVSSELGERVYTRKMNIPIGALQLEQITLLYESEKNEVTLIREQK